MARFFFHFFDGEGRSDDEWGLELAGPEAAYLEAVAAARAMWPELLAERRDPTRCGFQVNDSEEAELFRLDFAELLDECRGSVMRPLLGGETLARRLEETHRRASSHGRELGAVLDDVYRSLGESSALLARLSRYERVRQPK